MILTLSRLIKYRYGFWKRLWRALVGVTFAYAGSPLQTSCPAFGITTVPSVTSVGSVVPSFIGTKQPVRVQPSRDNLLQAPQRIASSFSRKLESHTSTLEGADGGSTSRISDSFASLTQQIPRRTRQIRRKGSSSAGSLSPRGRRPRNYWSNITNAEREIQMFWREALQHSIQEALKSAQNTDDQRLRLVVELNLGDDGSSVRTPLVIPNEVLLRYYNRHDLRAAIVAYGGRRELQQALQYERSKQRQHRRTIQVDHDDTNSSVFVMPGRWRDAVNEALSPSPDCRHMLAFRQLLDIDPNFTSLRPPNIRRKQLHQAGQTNLSPQISSSNPANPGRGGDDATVERSHVLPLSSPVPNESFEASRASPRWRHSANRNPRGYWTSSKQVIDELYDYCLLIRDQHTGRPAVWMPRLSEITANGRDDLRFAILRFFGTAQNICQRANMVSYQEWFYFDGLLELVVELMRYLDEHDPHGKYQTFPAVSDVKRNGWEQLHTLIQYYGGRKFLAARLGMTLRDPSHSSEAENVAVNRDTSALDFQLNFGPFNLRFAAELLLFVRQQEAKSSPYCLTDTGNSLAVRTISIPSPSMLARENRTYLHDEIIRYGGYENVARRLGLAYGGAQIQ
jgi:hypothetical protein